MTIQIVADSGCDIPLKLAWDKEINFTLIPLTLNVGEKSFLDDEKLNTMTMLNIFKETKGASSTACPSPEAFAESFRLADATFAVTMSSELSGTYQSAVIARDMVLAEFPDKKIHVINSLAVCSSETLIVMKLKELINDKNNNFETIEEKIEEYRKSLSLYFLIHSFESLIKAGRMSRISGMLATALSIFPICGDNGEGKIKVYEKVRGTKTALSRMVQMLGERAPTEGRKLVITHCNNEENANIIKELAEKMYNFKDIFIFPMRGLSSFYAGDKGLIVSW